MCFCCCVEACGALGFPTSDAPPFPPTRFFSTGTWCTASPSAARECSPPNFRSMKCGRWPPHCAASAPGSSGAVTASSAGGTERSLIQLANLRPRPRSPRTETRMLWFGSSIARRRLSQPPRKRSVRRAALFLPVILLVFQEHYLQVSRYCSDFCCAKSIPSVSHAPDA